MFRRALQRTALGFTWLLVICSSARAATVAVLDSDPGDVLGGGVGHVFTSVEDAHLEPVEDVLVVTVSSAPSDGWKLTFRPPVGGRLVPGLYEGAGALTITTTPSRCDTTTGRFALLSLDLSGRSPRAFAVDFEARCANATGVLHGAIRYQVGDESCASGSDGTPCDDGNACTQTDTCQGGRCAGGTLAECDDGNAATDDECTIQSGCRHGTRWQIAGTTRAVVKSGGSRIRQQVPLSGEVRLFTDGTYEIPQGTCPNSDELFPLEVGQAEPAKHGRLRLEPENLDVLGESVRRCVFARRVTIGMFDEWVRVGSAPRRLCPWEKPVPRSGPHMCGVQRIGLRAVVQGQEIGVTTVGRYTGTRLAKEADRYYATAPLGE